MKRGWLSMYPWIIPAGLEPLEPIRYAARMAIRWEGLAAMGGGALWVVTYVGSVLLGRQGERPDTDVSAAWLPFFAAFCGASLLLGTSLLGLHARPRSHARWTAQAGLLLATLAVATAGANLVLLTGAVGPARFSPDLGGTGVMAVCASTVLLGLAARKGQAPLPWAGHALIALGVSTVVLIAASTLSFGSVPAYVVDDLPFALAGAVWFALGLAMRARPLPSVDAQTLQ